MCGGKLLEQPAIELGHIFKLGTFYSVPFGATYLDEDGQEKPLVMGSYGIGPDATMAAIIEQHHDDAGIQWPASVAPYDVHVVVIPGAGGTGAVACRRAFERRVSMYCWTTATRARGRSSRTPTSSAARCA